MDFDLVNILWSKTNVLVPVPFFVVIFAFQQQLEKDSFAVVAAEGVVPAKLVVTVFLSRVPDNKAFQIYT